MKPLTRAELQATLCAVVGHRLPDPHRAVEPGLMTLSDRVAGAGAPRPAFRILVAEDNPVNQRVIMRILEKGGYEVSLADNGQAAAEMCRQQEYDAILMDVQMPVMDGFEAASEIRSFESQHARRRTPIIALTAHAMEGYRSTCLGAGMDGYLSKPVSSRQIFEALDDFLRPKTELSAR
jgi:CheY-like chemotaxis protein